MKQKAISTTTTEEEAKIYKFMQDKLRQLDAKQLQQLVKNIPNPGNFVKKTQKILKKKTDQVNVFKQIEEDLKKELQEECEMAKQKVQRKTINEQDNKEQLTKENLV